VSGDVQNVALSLRVYELESSVVLLLEALLMPTWSKNYLARDAATNSTGSLFPRGTVGALLHSFWPAAAPLHGGGVAAPGADRDEVDRLEDVALLLPHIASDLSKGFMDVHAFDEQF